MESTLSTAIIDLVDAKTALLQGHGGVCETLIVSAINKLDTVLDTIHDQN